MADSRPSLLRGFFAGAIHDSLLFPFPAPLDVRDPGEARIVARLIAALRGMQREGLIDSARFDADEAIPDEVLEAFAAAGLFGLTIPREYGGLGLSNTAYARVFGAVAVADASLAVIVGVHCGLGSKAIALYGTDAQKARYLPPLARGEMYAAYALTEPETGSDAQNLTTTAVPSGDGTGWVLSGRKIWIGLGHRAGVIATFAQTEVMRAGEPQQRPTAFLVRPDMPGFVVEDTERKLGIRGSSQARLRYDRLEVPADHVLGHVGKGFTVAVNVLNAGRLSLASGCTAGTRHFVDELVSYAEQRVQFGHPLADFEITQRKIAEATSAAYAADAMVGHLAAAMDNADAEISLEAAAVKVFASDLLWKTADDLVQLAGGRGFVRGASQQWPPYPYERYLRDARINRIFEGANEVLRLFIALNGIRGPGDRLKALGSALRAPLRNLGLVTGYAADRVRGVVGNRDRVDVEVHAALREHVRYFEKHVAELARAAESLVLRHRKRIIDRQLVLERLANMTIEMYATGCTIARTQRLIEEQGADGAAREIRLCDLFCVESGRRFRANRIALDADEEDVDDRRRDVAAAARAAGGYFVADAILDEPEPESASAHPRAVPPRPGVTGPS
ncbi:MAG TPA: acyl-CoA dehydrogenase family protein [Longimicrobiales bacterium]|nr:acyl-CoA dehydrogenase family protein [Longimicrobiales bacterium]